MTSGSTSWKNQALRWWKSLFSSHRISRLGRVARSARAASVFERVQHVGGSLEDLALVAAASELPRSARQPLGRGLGRGLAFGVGEVDDALVRRARGLPVDADGTGSSRRVGDAKPQVTGRARSRQPRLRGGSCEGHVRHPDELPDQIVHRAPDDALGRSRHEALVGGVHGHDPVPTPQQRRHRKPLERDDV
jgi:hypothetical protein